MITIVLTYRNRDLKSVENCLNSLKAQTNDRFEVVLVDYGSRHPYKEQLKILTQSYKFVELLRCETKQQLWSKSKAINMVLKKTNAPYLFVGDVDMIYHPSFTETLHDLKSNEEATGMTLFPSEVIKSINGYDEFYHGWGGEDTDVHERLKNAGCQVTFHNESVLILHQWHPKDYREPNDLTPFHSSLEQINHQYLEFSKQTKKVKANKNFEWGKYNELNYKALKTIDLSFKLTNRESEIKAFISNVLLSESGKVITISISQDADYNTFKQKAKKVLGKKMVLFLEIEIINNMLLECIVNNLRTNAYQFQYNATKQTIHFTIKL